MSSIQAHFSPTRATPPSEPLHDEDQNQPAEGERDASIADVSIADMSLLTAGPTKPIANEHATGYSEEGGSASIRLHGGSEQGSAEHVGAAARVQAPNHQPTGKHDHPPEIHNAQSALDDIKKILRPPREKGLQKSLRDTVSSLKAYFVTLIKLT